MSKSKEVNEGIIMAAKKFSDAFFDGLKQNAVDRMIKKAEDANVDPEVLKTMHRIKKDSEELKKLLSIR
jgi:hypothetical protein